jgi:hypothetical protein
MMAATFTEVIGDEVFVYVRGRLVMKALAAHGRVRDVPRCAGWGALE